MWFNPWNWVVRLVFRLGNGKCNLVVLKYTHFRLPCKCGKVKLWAGLNIIIPGDWVDGMVGVGENKCNSANLKVALAWAEFGDYITVEMSEQPMPNNVKQATDILTFKIN